MKTQGIVSELDIKTVTIQPWRVRNTIRKAGYNWVHPNIRDAANNLVRNPGSHEMAIWHPNQKISSEDLYCIIKSITTVIDGTIYNGRFSTVEELASYDKVFHEELGETAVVALGEKIRIDSKDYVAYRHFDGLRRRKLDIDVLSGNWPPVYHFLIVF